MLDWTEIIGNSFVYPMNQAATIFLICDSVWFYCWRSPPEERCVIVRIWGRWSATISRMVVSFKRSFIVSKYSKVCQENISYIIKSTQPLAHKEQRSHRFTLFTPNSGLSIRMTQQKSKLTKPTRATFFQSSVLHFLVILTELYIMVSCFYLKGFSPGIVPCSFMSCAFRDYLL